ncbi:hypothetical protein SDRG_00024 [Saprolegnia diclina VS20]|uniref:RanBP2-type domain-containing protein n=1 Tax=Saprolegnia diclina (strain VS20) TaxID=1156394 RepID=T0R753_SAPDV|nr:hypothetical protein SDRG_00024 [Saprolegnia diclina VS20]EQC42285.1 hypothetical protein SDRG_00024 [Saprolegnia diclina VS20]|eukprot:XP_008603708.1 hypothetical protein SDRG_00024 [Saprolegnia diclina VS20]
MKRAHDDEDGRRASAWTGWTRVLKHVPLLSSFLGDEHEPAPAPPTPTRRPKSPLKTTPLSPARRSGFTFARIGLSDDQPETETKAEPVFEFTRKTKTPPKKARKVLDSSVHDQGNDDEQYVPGTYSEPVVRYARARTDEPLVPINLFEERPAKQAKLSRGALIKSYALSREERRLKRPAPSRLLAAQSMDERQEHAKAVTDRILATLQALESDPLAQEAKKPLPSMSMSWKKYHLEVQDNTATTNDVDMSSKSPKTAFPTQSLPIFAPQPPVVQPPTSVAPPPVLTTVTVASTPAPSATPAPAVFVAPKPATTSVRKATGNVFAFGLPPKDTEFTSKESLLNVPVAYAFSKPPSMKVAPVKALTSQKPAVQPVQVVPTAAPVTSPPTFSKSTAPTTTSTGSNPLDKFKQSAPGGWKCPSCYVANKDTQVKCPCCNTDKPSAAPVVAAPVAPSITAPVASTSAPAPAMDSSNPLARFLVQAPGTWQCPGCKVHNKAAQAKCPCCNTDKSTAEPAPVVTSEPESKKKRKASDDSNSAPAKTTFAFTVPTTDASAPVDVTDKPLPTFGFSAPAAKTADAPSAGFSFGISSTDKPTDKPAAGFSFSAPAADKPTDKPAAGFSFSAPASEKPTDKPAAGFSFSAPASEKPTDKPATGFGFSAATTDKPATGFGFSAATTDKAADKPAVSLGFGASTAEKPSTGFGFGASSPADKPAEKSATGFSFGAADKPADKPALGFGFGATTSAAKPDEKKTAMSFGFGVDKPADAAAKPVEADKPAEKATMSFGAFGATADKATTSFGFGAATPKDMTETPAAPALSFGTASSAPPADKALSFGTDKPTTSPSFTFGANKTTAEAPAPSTSFNFGASKPTDSLGAFGATADKPVTAFGDKPTFTFGGASTEKPAFSTPATTEATRNATSFGFGSSAPSATTTFGAPSSASAFASPSPTTAFGAAPPAAFNPTAFGAAPAATPAFGAPTASTGFGSSSAFGSSAPAPAFNAAPSFGAPAPAAGAGFGAAPAPSAFGAPTAFGGNNNSGFGAPAASAFGGAPAFGAPAANAFGAAPAAPFGGGFNAAPPAAAGGFSMGQAPPKQGGGPRRIVRARSVRK